MTVKDQELTQLRRYLIMGVPVSEVCQLLKISRRTYYRYLKRIYLEDREMIQRDAYDKMVIELQIFKDRIGRTIMNMTEMAEDRKVPELIRQQAERIKLEAAWAQVMLQSEGPRILAQMPKHIQGYAKGVTDPTTTIALSLPIAAKATTSLPARPLPPAAPYDNDDAAVISQEDGDDDKDSNSSNSSRSSSGR